MRPVINKNEYRPSTTPNLPGVGRRIMQAETAPASMPTSIDINILGEMVKLGYHEDQVRDAVNS